MSRNLAIKEDLLNEQRRENDRIMLSLMPEQVVARYREGEETISQDHQDVTVIFADIVQFTPLSARLAPEELVTWLNGVFSSLDQLAEHGRVRVDRVDVVVCGGGPGVMNVSSSSGWSFGPAVSHRNPSPIVTSARGSMPRTST